MTSHVILGSILYYITAPKNIVKVGEYTEQRKLSRGPRQGAHYVVLGQLCDLRPSVLGQDRPENKKKSVLVLVLVLQVWCCVVTHGLMSRWSSN